MDACTTVTWSGDPSSFPSWISINRLPMKGRCHAINCDYIYSETYNIQYKTVVIIISTIMISVVIMTLQRSVSRLSISSRLLVAVECTHQENLLGFSRHKRLFFSCNRVARDFLLSTCLKPCMFLSHAMCACNKSKRHCDGHCTRNALPKAEHHVQYLEVTKTAWFQNSSCQGQVQLQTAVPYHSNSNYIESQIQYHPRLQSISAPSMLALVWLFPSLGTTVYIRSL